jgi:signal transduction histidine kinase
MVDLARAVEQTLKLLASKLGRKTVETNLAAVPPLSARAGELEQVLVNLVDNALRAVSDEGHLRIRLALEGETICLAVADNGVGMSEEVRRQACEPFFTTRPAGQGTGLGLAIVASIVHGHGGSLTIESEPGKGTEITLRLPTSGATEPAPS